MELVSAADFDPDGDQAEHAEEVDLAIDGDPATAWSTESYEAGTNVEDAAAKPGVGLIVETEAPIAARTIEITSALGGWSGEIYGSPDGPPEDLAGWGEPLAGITDAETEQSTTLNVPGENQFFLIWITDLAEGEDGFNVVIENVAISS